MKNVYNTWCSCEWDILESVLEFWKHLCYSQCHWLQDQMENFCITRGTDTFLTLPKALQRVYNFITSLILKQQIVSFFTNSFFIFWSDHQESFFATFYEMEKTEWPWKYFQHKEPCYSDPDTGKGLFFLDFNNSLNVWHKLK